MRQIMLLSNLRLADVLHSINFKIVSRGWHLMSWNISRIQMTNYKSLKIPKEKSEAVNLRKTRTNEQK